MDHQIEILSIAFGYGLALMIAIHSCVGVSGAHLNPAVTLSFTALGHTKWTDVPAYWAGQYCGAFTAAAVIYGIYYDLIQYRLDHGEITEEVGLRVHLNFVT